MKISVDFLGIFENLKDLTCHKVMSIKTISSIDYNINMNKLVFFKELAASNNYVYHYHCLNYNNINNYRLYIQFPSITTSHNKRNNCSGCYVENPWTCILPYSCNNIICPCSDCLIKGVCKEACDKLWEYYFNCLRYNNVNLPDDDVLLKKVTNTIFIKD